MAALLAGSALGLNLGVKPPTPLDSASQSGGPFNRVQQKKCTFIGAPFCEGQNLAGADLAPTAIRRAGIRRAAEKLGWEWDDVGDLDFAQRFAERGIQVRTNHLEDLQRYQKWVKSGMKDNFSIWCAQNPTAAQLKAKFEEKLEEAALSDVGGERGPEEEHEAPEARPHGTVVNSRLMGTGLELVYEAVKRSAQSGAFSLTVGGDHSVAAASIAAQHTAYPQLGIIWVDAHADANTPATSPSGHYHGMPAAHLMGWFKERIEGFDWFPEGGCVEESRLAYIGLRDIDAEEGQMLRDSNVHVYTMRDVDKYGIARVIEMAMRGIDPNGRLPIHLSLDVDSVDPQFAPGTGTCARGGLTYREIHYVCEELALTDRLVGMDLVEVNPALESTPPPAEPLHGDNPDLKPTTPTVLLATELVLSALGKTIM